MCGYVSNSRVHSTFRSTECLANNKQNIKPNIINHPLCCEATSLARGFSILRCCQPRSSHHEVNSVMRQLHIHNAGNSHYKDVMVMRLLHLYNGNPQIAKFMGPTWGPPGSCRPQMGPMLASWALLLRSLYKGISRLIFFRPLDILAEIFKTKC